MSLNWEKAAIGIEFGSTRIKAVLVDEAGKPLASGDHGWENHFENGIWTYPVEEIWAGLQDAYGNLAKDVQEKFGAPIQTVGAIGISAMMHGLLAFDKDGKLLTPFRTWRNTMTGEEAEILTKELGFNIPQRWSISHLYKVMRDEEPFAGDVAFVTTLAGYIHWQLTGEKVLGIGDASGMFPIDSATKDYDAGMLKKFEEECAATYGLPWKTSDVLPKVLAAGEAAGKLTEEGAKKLDPSGNLSAGILFAPPEGDAGTGMTATNSVSVGTGNVSAGTSIFAMVVVDKPMKEVHPEIDMVTTPAGDAVAMVHCNNCTSDINAWANVFSGFAKAAGAEVDTNRLYTSIFESAVSGKPDCGGLMSFNYLSGEPVTGFDAGRPMVLRDEAGEMNFPNFARLLLYSAVSALKYGLDILFKEENVPLKTMYGHGGFFKTPVAGQKIMAAAMNAPVTVMETAGEGGPWGMAVLARYAKAKADGETDASLGDYLNSVIFAGAQGSTVDPDPADVAGFDAFMQRYVKAFPVEQAAVEHY